MQNRHGPVVRLPLLPKTPSLRFAKRNFGECHPQIQPKPQRVKQVQALTAIPFTKAHQHQQVRAFSSKPLIPTAI